MKMISRLLSAATLGAMLLAATVNAHSQPTLAVPERGAYTGAYVDFGEGEDHVTAAAIKDFEQLVGKHQAIIGSSSYWGRGDFPAENVRIISQYGAVPLLYWSPWGPPYEQDSKTKPDQFGLAHIVAGDCDSYIDQWAAGAKKCGKPLLVSFACEPNSNWFPWSGKANGADTADSEGGGPTGPELYKRAYRHAVDRVRAAGAINVAWVFHVNSDSVPNKKWNAMREYYPGKDYVDWLGMSAYGQLTPSKHKDEWQDWADVMDGAYQSLCALDPAKPVMLAEWGVGEFPESGDKKEYLQEAFEAMNAGKYPRLKAAVFWHERWQNHDESYSNLRVNSSPGALQAYQEGVAAEFWVGQPRQKE